MSATFSANVQAVGDSQERFAGIRDGNGEKGAEPMTTPQRLCLENF
jgi:hypothetical protein